MSADETPSAGRDVLAWDAAIDQALRAVDARLATASEPCRRTLIELRFELTMLLRQPGTSGGRLH